MFALTNPKEEHEHRDRGITMTQSKQNKDASPATKNATRRLGHWMRVVVMFLSFGFIFPHALTEDMNIARNDTIKRA
jgi:hypothetical protein